MPEDGKTDVLLSPELQAHGLAGTAGDIHSETRWQVSRLADDFSAGALVLDVASDSQLTTFIVPDLILDIDATYYWRVKFHYASGAQSEWSAPFSFATITTDEGDQNTNGIPDSQEIDDPNLDLDANGTPDRDQADMKGVKSGFDNAPLVVQAAANVTTIESLRWIDPDTIVDVQNRPDDLPVGLLNFKLSLNTPGATAEVIVYFFQAVPAGARWVQYNPLTGWQDYSAHAVFSADGKSVTLAFMDGGFGDVDGAANGVIVDPSGIGTTAVTPPGGNDPPVPDPVPDPPGANDPPAPDPVTDPPVANDPPAPDPVTDPPVANDPPAPDPAAEPPGSAADPGTAAAASGGGGGGGGCLISTAASGFYISDLIPGFAVFIAFLLIGFTGFGRKTETSYETTPKWHSFLMVKLAVLVVGLNSEPQNIE